MSLFSLTLHDAGEKLRRREISSQELTGAVFKRISDTDDRIGAYITLCREEAMAQAREADRHLQLKTRVSSILGIPLAVKDNLLVKNVRTTCASKMLSNFNPPFDATAVARIRAGGAVIIGKTNLDEFAMGSSGENSAFFTTRNPWDLQRVSGGSSGGSAAAVAANQCVAALGTDTGGSIRQPASFCGGVGLKPTYGRVSRFGIVAFASSMDQAGPLTKDVRDCALLLEAISGHDPADATSADLPVPEYSQHLTGDVAGLRIGMPREYFSAGLQPAVEQGVCDAIRRLEKNGAIIEEISLPHTDHAIAVYYVVATAEASSNLARYDGIRFGHRSEGKDLADMYQQTRAEGFGVEVKRRIMLGTYALSAGYYDAYYLKAQRVRTLIFRDFEQAFRRCDVLITPTTPTTAFRIGEKIEDPLAMYLSDICTISINLAGLPALSIPCGLDLHGLPIGMQIIGKHFDEGTILRVAHAYEQESGWHENKPTL